MCFQVDIQSFVKVLRVKSFILFYFDSKYCMTCSHLLSPDHWAADTNKDPGTQKHHTKSQTALYFNPVDQASNCSRTVQDIAETLSFFDTWLKESFSKLHKWRYCHINGNIPCFMEIPNSVQKGDWEGERWDYTRLWLMLISLFPSFSPHAHHCSAVKDKRHKRQQKAQASSSLQIVGASLL